MTHFTKYALLLLLLSFCGQSYGQRFSFLVEAGPLRGQIDGDRLQGFFYNGYTAGIGSNISLTNEHFISVKTSYYNQGSTMPEQPQFLGIQQNFRMETDLQTIGLEMSYKFKPWKKNYLAGLGFVRHQIVNLEYEVTGKPLPPGEGERILDPEQINSGFTSIKLYGGFVPFPRSEIYFSLESSMTSLLNRNFFEIKALVPYSLAAVFTYEIIAPKEVQKKIRPGSKTRVRKDQF